MALSIGGGGYAVVLSAAGDGVDVRISTNVGVDVGGFEWCQPVPT